MLGLRVLSRSNQNAQRLVTLESDSFDCPWKEQEGGKDLAQSCSFALLPISSTWPRNFWSFPESVNHLTELCEQKNGANLDFALDLAQALFERPLDARRPSGHSRDPHNLVHGPSYPSSAPSTSSEKERKNSRLELALRLPHSGLERV